MKSALTFILFAGLTIFGSASVFSGGNVLSGSGKASYYGERFHGKLTASGTVFNMNEMTTAHRSLPFGTKVKITNLRNGKSVVVKVTDRGPFVKSREFDLSKAAFQEIASISTGVISIEYEIIS